MKMPKSVDSVLKDVLSDIKPSKGEMKEAETILKAYLDKVKKSLQSKKINADIFVGGSFAKKTIIKKDVYDIDIFIRFDKKYKDELLSDITEKVLSQTGKIERVHGSRDYFKIKAKENLFFEVVPVRKVSNPREAANVTDLSYSHVNYVKKKLKTEKILDEVILAKAFCHANGVYGAESYINGFSGYGIELLVYYYKGFLKFLNAVIKADVKKKTVIDIEKHHKNKNSILMDLNEAKLKSPIILVDPTFKQRNVLAALSEETFINFQKSCRDFLKNPGKEFFIPKTEDLGKIKEAAEKKGFDFVSIEISTDKQEGDVAGSKLLKFYKHLAEEAEKFFEIKDKGFEYYGKKMGKAFLVGKKRDFILITGPEVSDQENSKRFRARHKTISIKNGRIYAKERTSKNLADYLNDWKLKNIFKLREMAVNSFEVSD